MEKDKKLPRQEKKLRKRRSIELMNAVNKGEISGENTEQNTQNSVLINVGFYLAIPFYVVYKILFWIYKTFISIPNEPMQGRGFLRSLLMSFIIVHPTLLNGRFDEFSWTGIFFSIIALWVVANFFLGIWMFIGFYEGQEFIPTPPAHDTGYENIDRALEFRDGKLAMMTNEEKIKELGRYGYFGLGVNGMNNVSPEMKKTLGFLDGKLGMMSNEEKLRYLKTGSYER